MEPTKNQARRELI